MNILWLTENYPPSRGGMSHSCDRIINGIRDAGLQVHIVHFTNRKKPFKTEINVGGSYTACLKSADVEHGLHLTLNFLETFVQNHPCDALLAFGGLIPLTAAPVYSQLLNLPLYTCFRGNDFDVSLFSFKRRAMLLQCLTASTAVFAVSQDKVSRLEKMATDTKVYYSPNSIDLTAWQPLNSELDFSTTWRSKNCGKNLTVIGLFGYLKKKKGIFAWLEALRASGRMKDVHLLMSGDLEAHVLELLEQCEVKYTLLPFLDRVELIKYYLVCEWVVIPSYYDGFPNVLLEAGGLGIPVIASRVDGMKDILKHRETGVLFDPLILESATSGIKTALNLNASERQRLADNLKQLILEKYTLTREIASYVNVFKKNHHLS